MGGMKWAVVQHSGFGYAGKPAFKKGLELRIVDTRQAKKVVDAGGVIFGGYPEADNYIFEEMYKDVQGMVPKAPGTFSKQMIDGLRIYVPEPEED